MAGKDVRVVSTTEWPVGLAFICEWSGADTIPPFGAHSPVSGRVCLPPCSRYRHNSDDMALAVPARRDFQSRLRREKPLQHLGRSHLTPTLQDPSRRRW